MECLTRPRFRIDAESAAENGRNCGGPRAPPAKSARICTGVNVASTKLNERRRRGFWIRIASCATFARCGRRAAKRFPRGLFVKAQDFGTQAVARRSLTLCLFSRTDPLPASGCFVLFLILSPDKIYSETCDGAHELSGSTPRTPGAAASGTQHVYKVAPGGDYDTGNSEYSSSDDDTSYGGKQA
jgi:hypothetical protein